VIPVDEYVFDVLLRDLVGHDRAPSAFLVYLHLWGASKGLADARVPASLQQIAESTGLSKSAVQSGLRILVRRKLLKADKQTVTSIPEYRVLRPWRR
jgi:hypothetical protein